MTTRLMRLLRLARRLKRERVLNALRSLVARTGLAVMPTFTTSYFIDKRSQEKP